jgi:hypothetical protein
MKGQEKHARLFKLQLLQLVRETRKQIIRPVVAYSVIVT